MTGPGSTAYLKQEGSIINGFANNLLNEEAFASYTKPVNLLKLILFSFIEKKHIL